MNQTAGAGSALERIVRQDRLLVGAGLLAVVLLAWIDLWRMAADMSAMAAEAERHARMGMDMPDMRAWDGGEFAGLFLMWAVMMVAMMLPSAAPVMLLVVGTYRRRGQAARALTAAFGGGYVAAWTGFSAFAALTQLGLHRAALLSPAMSSASTLLGAAILIAAGLYQFLPIKNACLAHCRSPLHFLTHEWREGPRGAFRMGVVHGAYCVGCCWALMALLFVAGVMNLLWVAAIAAFVLVEKLARQGPVVGRAAGFVCVVWGISVLVRGL